MVEEVDKALPRGFARYGLDANPYAKVELDPLADAAHDEMLVRVDGFSKVDEIAVQLERAVADEQPCFFLVVGPSGAGRTSFANLLLARYCQLRRIDREHFIVPRRKAKMGDFDHVKHFHSWMTSLDLASRDFALSPALEKALGDLSNVNEATLGPRYQNLAKRLAYALKTDPTHPGAFALCMEGVRSYKLIEAAFEIFDDVPTVCVFTVLDDAEGRAIGDSFRRDRSPTRDLIKLSPLNTADATATVEQRWQRATRTALPFDPRGLDRALSDAPRPVGRVMRLIEELLNTKVHPPKPGPPYPDDPKLFFTEDEIVSLLQAFERLMPP